jgi:hypothetical protein
MDTFVTLDHKDFNMLEEAFFKNDSIAASFRDGATFIPASAFTNGERTEELLAN